jgi:hypothetical protein
MVRLLKRQPKLARCVIPHVTQDLEGELVFFDG